MKNFSILSMTFTLLLACSQSGKKNFLAYGTGAGTGMASYTLVKSWLGKSGSGGNIPQVVAVTTLGTLLGVFMGSEIADNLIQDEKIIVNESLNSDEQTTWKKVEDEKEIVAKITPTEKLTNDENQECKRFDWHIEDGAEVKKGSGIACKNTNGEWETLGSSMM